MMEDAEEHLIGFKSDRTKRLPPKIVPIPGETYVFGLFLNALNGFESKVMGFRWICSFISFLEKEKALWLEGGIFNIPHFGSLLN